MTRNLLAACAGAAVLVLALAAGAARPSAQAQAVDIDALGPQVGQPMIPFSGTDQFGTRRSLESIMGPKGAMVVFFRSADW
ncbi:MAG: hypothetical protein AB7O67_02145 [Vicinamibacterales bacterium]